MNLVKAILAVEKAVANVKLSMIESLNKNIVQKREEIVLVEDKCENDIQVVMDKATLKTMKIQKKKEVSIDKIDSYIKEAKSNMTLLSS